MMNHHSVCIKYPVFSSVHHKASVTTGVGNAAAERRKNNPYGLSGGNGTGTKAGGVNNAA